MSDGSVITCDKTNYRDLYDAIPVSYGTLGFLVSVTIDIIPYKPYLKHTYYSVPSIDELVKKFEKETEDPSNDTVEGIMFSKDKSVVMSGQYVDDIEVKMSSQSSKNYFIRFDGSHIYFLKFYVQSDQHKITTLFSG